MASSNDADMGAAKEYPYPVEFNVRDFVPYELSEENYHQWKDRMEYFIERRGLVDFINGNITNGEPKKTDSLVSGWIVTTITDDFFSKVRKCKTALEIWIELETLFDPTGFSDKYSGERQLGEEIRNRYDPLFQAIYKGNWEMASKFIEGEPTTISDSIMAVALLISCRSPLRSHITKKLLEKIPAKELAHPGKYHATALHWAAQCGNIEIVKLLVSKNPDLINIADEDKELPLHWAVKSGSRETVQYLYQLTWERRNQLDPNPFDAHEQVLQLLRFLVYYGYIDIALEILKWKPELACINETIFMAIATSRMWFRSGTHLNFQQNLIYSVAPVTMEDTSGGNSGGGDVENPMHHFISAKQRFQEILWVATETSVPQIKRIREMKVRHHQAVELVKCICREGAKIRDIKLSAKIFAKPFFEAIREGIPEIVEEIIMSYPYASALQSPKNRSIFHLAIEHRCENVFNLVYQFADPNTVKSLLTADDISENNCLHLAGYLGPQQQLHLRRSAAGPALQMQRELQWFKEVEKHTPLTFREDRNKKGKKPAEVFTESHNELVKEGERWMKDTANSCIIVAALVVTIMFAAAITVPGGNKEGGYPNFSKEKAFIVFGISDALGLFSSTTSLLMFLSILTSRYAEYDFLHALPKRLIIGLVTLFISTLSMMIAFCAALYLLSGYSKVWVLIPVVALASIPLYLFVALQFPLLVEMIKSTYGRGLFYKQSDRILHEPVSV